MHRIVTLTVNPAVDKSVSVSHVTADRKLRCKNPHYEPGGGGINVSRVIHKLGEKSVCVYLAGGPYGQMLKELLDKENLRHSPIFIKGLTRENLTVLSESTDRQFRFNMPGPSVGKKEWEGCLHKLSSFAPRPDYIVASGSLPPGVPEDFYARVAQIAKKTGARVIVDTSGEALRLAAEAGVYLLKPNISELQGLTGGEIEGESQQKELAMELVRSGRSKIVVVSLGTAGALVASKEGCKLIRAPFAPIRSRVGAGDSMVGGIILTLAQGRSLEEAVQFGVAAGSAAVMTPGTELCRKEDTQRLYQQLISSNRGAE